MHMCEACVLKGCTAKLSGQNVGTQLPARKLCDKTTVCQWVGVLMVTMSRVRTASILVYTKDADLMQGWQLGYQQHEDYC